jgi:hypothetical protein
MEIAKIVNHSDLRPFKGLIRHEWRLGIGFVQIFDNCGGFVLSSNGKREFQSMAG